LQTEAEETSTLISKKAIFFIDVISLFWAKKIRRLRRYLFTKAAKKFCRKMPE
jgi:hypothetical protein